MHSRKFVVALVFVAGALMGAAGASWAQVERAGTLPGLGQRFEITTDTAGKVMTATASKPLTLANESLGLRVTGRRQGRVVGTLVAKIDGQWIEVQFAPQDSYAAH